MKNKSNIILTGDRPTGKLHIGHYVGSLKERVRLQNDTKYDDLYIMIADAQALTDNSGNPQKVKDNIIEVMLDYLAVGLDPKKSTFFLQSSVTALPELTAYYMNLVTLPRLLRNPTVKSEVKYRGYEGNNGIPVGFANYPISQAADITAFMANIIPVGDDQLPMIEQTREIVRSFNSVYGDTLVEPEAFLPEKAICYRLPGTDGKAKMSKSIGNCIYLSDSKEELKRKVMSMYTDPNHLKVEDKGNTKNNPVFIYLDAFVNDAHFIKYLPEYKNLEELKKHYEHGGLGDMKVKKFLYDVLEQELEPIRELREEWTKRIPEIYEILKQGTRKANEAANKTLDEVKAAIGINYFSNEEFLNEQIKKYNN